MPLFTRSCNQLPCPRAKIDGALTQSRRTDIEQEANGLYSFDRREKLDTRRVKAVIDEAVQAFYARVDSL